MIRKPFEIIGGFFLLLAGFVMALPLVPGPGIVVMILGLVILARHFHWARRMLAWAKAKWETMRQKVERSK